MKPTTKSRWSTITVRLFVKNTDTILLFIVEEFIVIPSLSEYSASIYFINVGCRGDITRHILKKQASSDTMINLANF